MAHPGSCDVHPCGQVLLNAEVGVARDTDVAVGVRAGEVVLDAALDDEALGVFVA